MNTPPHRIPWQDLAQALRFRMGAGCLQPQVEAFLRRPETERVLVACSGGPDSVCMLALLWASAERFGVECVVAHYNHRWRGPDSDADAAFVAAMAAGLGCPLVTDVRPEKEAAFTETTARALRLEFLRKAARQQDCTCIAFGHQQCDILETQLLRLARGSGTDGLAAPRPVNPFEGLPTHIRPLLTIHAGDVRMALAACGLPWRDDRSNEDLSIARNALRHRVIPGLADALGRDVSRAASRSRRLLEEDAAALDQLARAQFEAAYRASARLDRAALQAAPHALTRRALGAWLAAHGIRQALSAAAMDLLVDSVYSGQATDRHSVGSRFVVLSPSAVALEVAAPASELLDLATLKAGESLILPTGALLETEYIPVDVELLEDLQRGAVDPGREAFIALEQPSLLQVRGRRPGDRFRPLGAPGTAQAERLVD